MQLLINQNQEDRNDDMYQISSIDKAFILNNQILDQYDDKIGWDFNNIISNKKNNKDYTESYNSIRIDRFFIWKELCFSELINIWYLISWIWLSNIKSNYPDHIFFCTLQFDKWDKDVPQWLFLKLFEEEWYTEYFKWDWIMAVEQPYIVLSL